MNEDISYRYDVRASDGDDIRRLVESSGFFSSQETGIAMELIEERISQGIQSGYHFLFAERAGNTVGYTCFGPVPGTLHSYDLYWIVVHYDFRQRGIGKLLLSKTEAIIRKGNGQRIYIDTSSRDQYGATRMFYEACGYRQEAVVKDFYGPGDSKVIYVKTFLP
jgi:ribosomal protein S18 acetylase RimI-like enzyme